jgi:DNA polymerase-3 subunit beta
LQFFKKLGNKSFPVIILMRKFQMKLTLERSHLLKCLSHVHRVVERRNTIPILSNVLLKAEEDRLVIRATDLDMEILETLPAMLDEPGSTTVPAHMLHDIVRKLPDGADITLSTRDDSTMILQSGRSRFELQCLPESDFPDITVGTFSNSFAMQATEFRRLIELTQFAISTEETRYYLNGIYFHLLAGDGAPQLCAVATDGHRLAKATASAPQGTEEMPGVIIPRKAVGELFKLVSESDDSSELTLELSEAKIRVTCGAVVLTSKMIDGTFPDYERVIPTGNTKRLLVERRALASAVDRVSTIASERGRAVKMSLADQTLVLSVNNPDSGSATEELAIDYEGEPMDIGFNARYVLDITGQLTTEKALFLLSDASSPTIIHNDGQEDDVLYVLMPMRV